MTYKISVEEIDKLSKVLNGAVCCNYLLTMLMEDPIADENFPAWIREECSYRLLERQTEALQRAKVMLHDLKPKDPI